MPGSGSFRFVVGFLKDLFKKLKGRSKNGRVDLTKTGENTFTGTCAFEVDFIDNSDVEIESLFNLQLMYDDTIDIHGKVQEINGWCNRIQVQSADNMSVYFSNVTIEGQDEIVMVHRLLQRMTNAFNSDYTVQANVKAWKKNISEQVYSDFADTRNNVDLTKSGVDTLKEDAKSIKKYLDDNKLDASQGGGGEVGWLYAFYNPAGLYGQEVGTDGLFQNAYSNLQRLCKNILRFFGSGQAFTPETPLYTWSDGTYTWPSFTSYCHNNLKDIKDRLPDNLAGILANIQNTANTASGSAGMASQYSQQNANTLAGLKSDVDIIKANISDLDYQIKALSRKLDSFFDEDLPAIKNDVQAMREMLDLRLPVIQQSSGNAAIYASTAATNSQTAVNQNTAIKAVVDKISIDTDNILNGVDGISDIASDVSNVKDSLSDVSSDVEDVKSALDELEDNIKKYAAWVVQCHSTLVSRIFIPFSRCFGSDIVTVEASDNLPSIISNVSYGVVDVDNSIFKCPSISGFWPYWPVYEESKTAETCRFVSEDIGGALAFYYYPLG